MGLGSGVPIPSVGHTRRAQRCARGTPRGDSRRPPKGDPKRGVAKQVAEYDGARASCYAQSTY